MILPIITYGHTILRQPCIPINPDHAALDVIIDNLWQTMRNASGCGLAAPQIGLPLQLFIVDSASTYQQLDDKDRSAYYEPGDAGILEVFINAHISEYSTRTWYDDEGCLSIPGLNQSIPRSWSITIAYYDQHFKQQRKVFAGTTARMIQHEYDHTLGILHIDRLGSLARRRLASKLQRIAKGHLSAPYPVI